MKGELPLSGASCNAVRRVAAGFLGLSLVWLEDGDGELNLRLVRSRAGRFFAVRLAFGIRTVGLLPEGKVTNGAYVIRWIPANEKAKALFRDTVPGPLMGGSR